MASLSELRTSVRRLIDEKDAANTHFADAELNDYLNQATLFLGVKMEWPLQTSTADGVEGQALYSLPADFVSLVDVYYNQHKLISLDRDDLNSITLGWQDAENGTPRYVYKADNFVIGLYPPASASEAGEELLQIQYIQVPSVLSADADVPDLHQAYQLCLPFYAAYMCEASLGNDKKSTMQLAAFDLHQKLLMSRVQRFDGDSVRFKWGVFG